ncbi:MAG: IS66 family insertion sequence element accessory protein TnpA [Gammaproteobacteria bacterium]
MEGKERELTASQQAYFEHVRQAKAQGLSLTAYCEKLGLNVRSLYGVRRDLVRKGILPRTLAPTSKQARPSKFVAVQVAPSRPNGAEPVCRVRHPSGWTIECSGWPEAGWVSALLKGGTDASA